jgi:hypothetical protein
MMRHGFDAEKFAFFYPLTGSHGKIMIASRAQGATAAPLKGLTTMTTPRFSLRTGRMPIQPIRLNKELHLYIGWSATYETYMAIQSGEFRTVTR